MHSLSRPLDSLPTQRTSRMQQQFERGVPALLVMAAVAGLALMALRPVAGDGATAHVPAPTLPASALDTAEAAPLKRTHRRSRQTLAMPYFSFAAGN